MYREVIILTTASVIFLEHCVKMTVLLKAYCASVLLLLALHCDVPPVLLPLLLHNAQLLLHAVYGAAKAPYCLWSTLATANDLLLFATRTG